MMDADVDLMLQFDASLNRLARMGLKMSSRHLFLSALFIFMFAVPLHAFRTPWNQEFAFSYTPSINYRYLYPGGLTDDAGAYSFEYNLQLGYQPQQMYTYFGIEFFWARGEAGPPLAETEYARKKTFFPDNDDNWVIHPSMYQILLNVTLVTPLLTDYTGMYFRAGGGMGGGSLFQNQSRDSQNIFFAHEAYGHVPYTLAYSFESGLLFRIPFIDRMEFPDFPIFLNATYNTLYIDDATIQGEELYAGKINFSHVIYSLGIRFQF